jgi:uncharacterized membrane protein YedE/YeeE
METIQQHSIWIFIIFLALCVMTLFIVTWISSEVQNTRFHNRYIYLRDFVINSNLDDDSYKAIRAEFDNVYCYTDRQKAMVKSLWFDFTYKFREFCPYVYDIQKERRAI